MFTAAMGAFQGVDKNHGRLLGRSQQAREYSWMLTTGARDFKGVNNRRARLSGCGEESQRTFLDAEKSYPQVFRCCQQTLTTVTRDFSAC